MTSLLHDFEYDIFVSYRQKDNKGDRWVSEFVNSLKTEIESTFKEDVSIYFDENPHDGLLETHDVDASLKMKLKCLVFIPIVSRTYCDPKSFAWEHEFKAFVELASNDSFGLKVILNNGNVGSRVLPVRIHDLDINDIKLCESIIGGPLRGVDFIYRSSGVNRPLRANEDHPHDNLTKTYYRDQMNKVANAIDDIIHSLKNDKQSVAENYNKGQKAEVWEASKPVTSLTDSFFNRISRKGLLIFMSVILLVAGAFAVYKIINLTIIEKTIALIPLQDDNKDPGLAKDGDLLLDAVREKLQEVKRITLKPRISCQQFRNTKISTNTVRRELRANYYVAGNVEHELNKTIIWVELIRTKNNKPLWFGKYLIDKSQIILVSKEIARNIASKLNVNISSEEKNRIDNNPTRNDNAYLNFISANAISGDAWQYYNMGNKSLDSTSFSSAIKFYDDAIRLDSVFALAYSRRAIARSCGYYTGQLDSTQIKKCREDIDKALGIDKYLTDAQIALGYYYYYCKKYDFQNALKHFENAARMDPGNYQPLFYMAVVYRKMGNWEKSQDLVHRVIKLNPQEPLYLTNIGLSYTYLHKYDSALIYHQKAIDMMAGWADPYFNKSEVLVLKTGTTSDARLLLDTAAIKTGERFQYLRILYDIYDGKFADAYRKALQSITSEFYNKGERYLVIGRIKSYLREPDFAKAYYDSALFCLNQELINNPDNYKDFGLAGLTYAGLGYRTEAVNAGKKSVELVSNNKLAESEMIKNLSQIYALVGDYDNSMSNIEYLLKYPSCFSIKFLQLDPVWKPLLKRPEFKTMLKKYSER